MELNHLAIIMDGNRRWAIKRHLDFLSGHKRGAEVLKNIAKDVARRKISYLTVFAFSSENWSRTDKEVSGLISLFKKFLMSDIQNLVKDDICLRIIGKRNDFDKDLQDLFNSAERQTKNCKSLNLTIAVNYGGQQDLVSAYNKNLYAKKTKINSSDIKNNLMTQSLPPVDFLIRTGGEKRISNFLIWDLAYTELYFSDQNWPNFTLKNLDEAINDFSQRLRRFGGDKKIKTFQKSKYV